MGNDMYNDERLAHAEIVQKETEDALGFWKDRALKAEAERDALLSRPTPPADAATEAVREAAEEARIVLEADYSNVTLKTEIRDARHVISRLLSALAARRGDV